MPMGMMHPNPSTCCAVCGLHSFFSRERRGWRVAMLTYHPGADCCPVWSKDGKSIYFISSRANKEQSYNIWKMNFNL